MSTALRVWFSLAGFLLIAGAVYGITSKEFAGAPLLLVAGATFCYLGLVGRSEARKEQAAPEAEHEVEEVKPTIWPLAFSLTGVIIVVGFIVNAWILAVGVAAFAVSAGGWLREIARGHP